MRITYEWTQTEWTEAVTLATAKRSRGSGVSGMVYALVGIPLVGAALDTVRALHASPQLTLRGSVVPLLLLGLFACLTVALLVSRWGRRKRMAAQAPMPQGQWEALLQEAGWSVQEKVSVTELASVSTPGLEEQQPSCEAENAAPPPAVSTGIAERSQPSLELQTVPSGTSVPHTPAAEGTDADASAQDRKTGAIMAATEPRVVSDAAERVAPAAQSTSRLEPWSLMTETRAGERVIVLLHKEGFVAVPLRCLSEDQASHLHRLVVRKLRPAPARPN